MQLVNEWIGLNEGHNYSPQLTSARRMTAAAGDRAKATADDRAKVMADMELSDNPVQCPGAVRMQAISCST